MNVDLYCNSKAALLLKEKLGLPYSNVFDTHNNLNIENEKLWALYKIFTYSLQSDPFLHLDGDVFLFKKLPASLLKSKLIAQNLEVATPENYSNTQRELLQHFIYFPGCVMNEFNTTKPIIAVNAGILGGSDTRFMKEYTKLAFEYVSKNSQFLSLVNTAGFNIFFEQHLFYSLAKEKGIEIKFLIPEIIDDNKYRHFGDFHEVPCKNNYLHLIGEYKQDEHTCRQMAAKLRELYPDYYYRIISLCKKKFRPLSISLYTDQKFDTIEDYIQFNEKSEQLYLKYPDIQVYNHIDKTDKLNQHRDEQMIMALLKKYISHSTNFSRSIKTKAINDLIKFQNSINEIMERNKDLCFYYLYGRDLVSVKWFCELFREDSTISKKMISKCKEVEIIKSGFNWGGLINKIKRIGVEYYMLLELEPGSFYNLVVPEVFSDGYSVHDLDEMEQIILQHLSTPILIKDLLISMYEYVEDDIIENHLDKYEHLIIALLKELVLKKAIKPYKI